VVYAQLLETHHHMTEVAAGRAIPTSLEQKGLVTQTGGGHYHITDGDGTDTK
jgi:hypothetical protein